MAAADFFGYIPEPELLNYINNLAKVNLDLPQICKSRIWTKVGSTTGQRRQLTKTTTEPQKPHEYC